MQDQIAWLTELTIEPGQLERFRELTLEMIEATRAEPGVLHYERFVDEHGTGVCVYERYQDSDAALAHLRMYGERFAERFMGLVTRTRFMVFGTPSDPLRQVLDGLGATYLAPFAGFVRGGPRW